MIMSRFLLVSHFGFQQLRYNSNRTCLVKVGREKYCRMYPTTVVNPDGSSYTIRYHEPRRIIHLPLYTHDLSAEELEKHLNRRKPKEIMAFAEELEDNFDLNRYSHLWDSKSKNKQE